MFRTDFGIESIEWVVHGKVGQYFIYVCRGSVLFRYDFSVWRSFVNIRMANSFALPTPATVDFTMNSQKRAIAEMGHIHETVDMVQRTM